MERPPAPGGKDSPADSEGQRERGSVGGQGELRDQGGALGLTAGIDLLGRHRGVAVEVEVEPLLERRDLGLVDHEVDEDAVGADPDRGVVVDREVAQRVRGGDPGKQHGREGGEDRRTGEAEASRGARGVTIRHRADGASHDAEGTRSGPRPG